MGTIKVDWKNPTTLKDGTPLPAGDLAYVDIEVSADGGANFTSVAHELFPATSHVFTDYPAGDYQIRLTAVDTQTPPLRGDPVTVKVTVPTPIVVLAPPGPVTDVVVTAEA